MRIYVAHRLHGGNKAETQANIETAIDIGKWLISLGHTPLVPHVFALIFDDDIPEQRDQGMSLGAEMLLSADELWVFGVVSRGIMHELNLAQEEDIPVHFYARGDGGWYRHNVRELGMMRGGMVNCAVCGKAIDVGVTFCCQRHGRVCPDCWSHEYQACQVCADREYAEEVRYG